MKSKYLWIIVCVFIFFAGLAGSILLVFKPHGNNVRIIQDGKVICTIDLTGSEDKVIETEYNGSKNVIQIQNHKIFVAHADCPDQICVKMGELKSKVEPIVCLPNKLVIEYTDDEIDAQVK